MSDPNKPIEQKAEQSEAETAKPQEAKPRVEPMPKLTDELCPTCHEQGIVRKEKRSWRIGEFKVLACRQEHRWSLNGGKVALKMLAKQQDKMRAARRGAPAPVPVETADETN